MKIQNYDRERATKLLPLLHSIASEIRERTTATAHLQEEIHRLSATLAGRRTYRDRIRDLREQLSKHEYGLRRVVHEIEELGCTIEPADPLTIRIPGTTNRPHHAYTWRAGDTQIELAQIEVGERVA